MCPRLSALRTISSFGQVWATGLAFRLGLRKSHGAMLRPRHVGRIPPISEEHVLEFIRQTGGHEAMYRTDQGALLVPHTYFATWGLAEMARVLHEAKLPLNFSHVVHAASTARVQRLQRVEEAGRFVATVETVSQRGNRVRIELQLVTTTVDGAPLAEYSLAIVLPGARSSGRGSSQRKSPSYRRTIPEDAREIASLVLEKDEGWKYARLSGDFNPIHWLAPVARLVGLKGTIAHGFDLMARANHAIVREICEGNPTRLRCMDVTFRRPVVLPAHLAVFVGEAMAGNPELGCERRPFWLGPGPGKEANVVGRFETGAQPNEPQTDRQ